MTLGTIADLARQLETGETTSEALVEAALDRAEAATGEGPKTFIRIYKEAALAEARASDLKRAQGLVPSPLAGLPVSIKDLADIQGDVTLAGSVVLHDQPPAAADAPVVARLRAAGAVIVGRTNMTEFAYSGVGLNPHYGTPGNPADRERIPGGSSSGAAVSVADQMAVIALGTDTGGSIRIPAALCGVAGFKPTGRRVPRDGIVPLSTTSDSVGPLGPTIACCVVGDQVMAGEAVRAVEPASLLGLRLGVPKHVALDELDAAVSHAFDAALARLAEAGARIVEFPWPEILEPRDTLTLNGILTVSEAYWWHADLFARGSGQYDPIVASRVARGADVPAHEYIRAVHERAQMIERASAVTRRFDAVVMPTTAVVAPTFADVATRDGFDRANRLLLRNTTIGNLLDRPAATVPCHDPDSLPVGLMVMGETLDDVRVQEIAQAVEAVVRVAG